MISKMGEIKDHNEFYKYWTEQIEIAFDTTYCCLNDVYRVKNNLSQEMAVVYVSSFMNYYKKLRFLYQVYIVNISEQSYDEKMNNYKFVEKEVEELLLFYKEFVQLVMSLNDFNEYKIAVKDIPDSFFVFDF